MSFCTTNSSRHSSSNYSKAMTIEQFEQVVEAIAEGRYSWACVLILRFAGYNPIHFIPVRTYSRLLKESRNRKIASIKENAANSIKPQHIGHVAAAPPTASRIVLDRELEYTEIMIERQTTPIQGGSGYGAWSMWSWLRR